MLMTIRVRDILACLEEAYPSAWAAPEDRVGLLVGHPETSVSRLLVALEASLPVVEEAREAGAEMLLTHHPLLYRPVGEIREDQAGGRLLAEVVRAPLAVVACHTNLDAAPQGLNEHLAYRLGLTESEVFASETSDSWCKLAVFVPVGYEAPVRQALFAGGAGVIGKYSHCSFGCRGQGTFLPHAGARPFHGEVARLSSVPESRLEVLLPESCLPGAVARLKAAHPYEEVAYDLYPLKNPGLPLGYGRLGRWPQPLPFPEAITKIKEVFQVPVVRVWGRPSRAVERVAVVGGSGGDLIPRAKQQGAQVYITGEVRHHQASPGDFEDFAVVEVGHFASEVVFMPAWAEQLGELFREKALAVQVLVSAREHAPFTYS